MWQDVYKGLPEKNQLVFLWDGYNEIKLGCRVDVSTTLIWAISNNNIYIVNNEITSDEAVSDCFIDIFYNVRYWHSLPKLEKPKR